MFPEIALRSGQYFYNASSRLLGSAEGGFDQREAANHGLAVALIATPRKFPRLNYVDRPTGEIAKVIVGYPCRKLARKAPWLLATILESGMGNPFAICWRRNL